jgi:hypothetical protein
MKRLLAQGLQGLGDNHFPVWPASNPAHISQGMSVVHITPFLSEMTYISLGNVVPL